MTDPLSQLRAANPVPDAALDDAALTRSEAVLSGIVDSGSRPPWKAVAAGIGVLALVGGVIPFVNRSEPVAVAEVLTHAGRDRLLFGIHVAHGAAIVPEHSQSIDHLADFVALLAV